MQDSKLSKTIPTWKNILAHGEKYFEIGTASKSIEKRNEWGMDGYSIVKISGKKSFAHYGPVLHQEYHFRLSIIDIQDPQIVLYAHYNVKAWLTLNVYFLRKFFFDPEWFIETLERQHTQSLALGDAAVNQLQNIAKLSNMIFFQIAFWSWEYAWNGIKGGFL